MELTDWERLLKLLRTFYYSEVFLGLCIIASIYIQLKFLKKDVLHRAFLFYSVFSFLFFLLDFPVFILNIFSATQKLKFLHSGNLIFSLIEYIVFYLFFKEIFTSRALRFIMFFALIGYSIFISYFIPYIYIGNPSMAEVGNLTSIVISLQLALLGCLCLLFFIRIIRSTSSEQLIKRPSFWITTGLFFYCVMIVPFFLLDEIIKKTDKQLYIIFYSAHYISLGLLFLFISKAILCKKPLIT